MIECGICLEEYQEGDLEQHQETCVVRLMFRCFLCNEDYGSKEGLWNHLDQHEIVDESKELHYQEIKAKHKLFQCVLCNDQRAYSESPYWKHVHDVHDGFFLRCSDCGENFRSEKLKNDHSSSRCRARDETAASDFNALIEEPGPIELENMTSNAAALSRGEQSSYAHEGLNNRLGEHSRDADKNNIDNESEVRTIDPTKSKDLQTRLACDICGITFPSTGYILRHKLTCPKVAKEHDDSQFSAEEISLLDGVKKAELELDIKVEETMLQEQEYQVSNEDPGRSSASALHLHGEKSKDVEAKDTDDHENEIEVKDEYLVDEEELLTELKTTTESSESPGIPSDRSESLVRHEAGVQNFLCSTCGRAFGTKSKMNYHMVVCHTEPQYKCPHCQKKFHIANRFRRHVKFCSKLRCRKCGMLFTARSQLKNHDIEKHRDGTLKDVGAKDADDPGNEIKDKEECLEDEEELRTERQTRTRSSGCGVSLATQPQLNNDNNHKHRDGTSKDVGAEDADDPGNEIKDKEECLEDEEELRTERQTRSKSSGCGVSLATQPQLNNDNNHKTGQSDPINGDFVLVKTCSFEDAKSFVQNFEFGFCMHVIHKYGKCNVRYYRCTRIKQKVRPQCERKVKICTPNANEQSMVYAKGEHSCINAPPENLSPAKPRVKLTKKQEDIIRKLLTSGVPKRAIRKHVKQLGENISKRRLQSAVQRVSKQLYESGSLSIINDNNHKHRDGTSKDVGAEDADDPGNEIKDKEECLEDEEELRTERQTRTKSSGCGVSLATQPQLKNDNNHKTGQSDPINCDFVVVKTCSFEDAKSFVQNFEFGFCMHTPGKGNVQYYRCTRIKQKVWPQCERKVKICTPNVNEQSMVYAKGEHSCINAPPENLSPVKPRVKLSKKQEDITRKVLTWNMLYRETGFDEDDDIPLSIIRDRLTSIQQKLLINDNNHKTGQSDPINCDFVLVKTCSFEDAKSFVQNFEFGFCISHKLNKANVRYYRCTRIKQRVRLQCERKVKIWTPNVNEQSMVYAKGEHSCINAPPENLSPVNRQKGFCNFRTYKCSIKFEKNAPFRPVPMKLSKKQEDIIRKVLTSGVPKRAIRKHVKLLGVNISKHRLRSAVQRVSKQLYESGSLSLINDNNHKTGQSDPNNCEYVVVKTCSIEDAKSFVQNFEFGFCNTHSLDKGNVRYYRCTRIKRKVQPQCERKVKICTPNVNEQSMVYAKGEHSCTNAPPENLSPVVKLSKKQEDIIRKVLTSGVPKRAIRKHVKLLGENISKQRLRSAVQRVSKQLYESGSLSLINDNNHKTGQSDPDFVVVKTCSFEDAKSFVQNFEFGFCLHMINNLDKGNVRYYRCTRIKQKVRPQCERKVKICTPNVNEQSMVYARGEHSCTNAPPENLSPESNVKKHIKLLGTAEFVHKCSFCPKKFRYTRSQRRHEESCSERQCNKCSVKFTKLRLLKNHMKHKHPNDDKSKDVESDTNTVESAECHEVPSDRNESLVFHEDMDVHSKVAKKKSHSQRRTQSPACTESHTSKRIRKAKN